MQKSQAKDAVPKEKQSTTHQANEHLLKALVDNASSLVIVLDRNACITMFNHGAENLTGYTEQEVLGRNWFELFVTPDDAKVLPKLFQDVLQQLPLASQHENSIRTKSQGERIIQWSNTALKDESGLIQAVLSIGQDVSLNRQTEQALLESEERASALLCAVPDMIFRISASGVFLDCRAKDSELYTGSKNAVIGRRIHDIFPAELAGQFQSINQLALDSGSLQTFEYQLAIPGQDVADYEARIVKCGSNEVVTFVRNVSERKTAERKLAEAERHYRIIADFAYDWEYWEDAAGEMKYVSPNCELITGYRASEFLNDSELLNRIVTEKDKELWLEHKCPTSLKNAGHREIQLTITHRDGRVIWIEHACQSIIDADGAFQGFRASNRDITRRIESEQALKNSEVKLRAIFDNSRDALGVSQQGLHAIVNPAYLRMFGYERESELIGTPIHTLIAPECHELVRQNVRAREAGDPVESEYELVGLRKDGSTFEMEVRISVYMLDDTQYTLAILRDISAQKCAERDKTALEGQLRRAQKLETIGTLAGGIAHDFNNILAPIMGYTELALDSLRRDSHGAAEDLEHVLTGANRAKDLVEQILLFSKRAEREHTPLVLQVIVKEVMKLLRPTIPSTIDIRLKIEDFGDTVLADASQIHQVVVNLCTNAWQAMGSGEGIMTIALKRVEMNDRHMPRHSPLQKGFYLCLSVSDTGSGMDEQTLERIFEPYFTTKDVDKGTGLGLSVVHGIVQSHQGDIRVESKLNQGSTFYVYLPRIADAVEEQNTESGVCGAGSETVLVVDDNEAVAQMTAKMLANLGYHVEMYTSSIKAAEDLRLSSCAVDLLLTDLTMPGMTGLELARVAHQTQPALPVLIMTGYGDKFDDQVRKEYNIWGAVGKPVRMNDLGTMLRSALKSRSRK